MRKFIKPVDAIAGGIRSARARACRRGCALGAAIARAARDLRKRIMREQAGSTSARLAPVRSACGSPVSQALRVRPRETRRHRTSTMAAPASNSGVPAQCDGGVAAVRCPAARPGRSGAAPGPPDPGARAPRTVNLTSFPGPWHHPSHEPRGTPRPASHRRRDGRVSSQAQRLCRKPAHPMGMAGATAVAHAWPRAAHGPETGGSTRTRNRQHAPGGPWTITASSCAWTTIPRY